MSSVPAKSTKRALKDVNTAAPSAAATTKKPKTATAVRTNDVQLIKSIIGDINDPVIKTALENIVKDPTKATTTVVTVVSPKKDEATIQKMTDKTIRTIQRLINDKLKWKSSYSNLKGGGTKGGRVEVVCTEHEVFERIFEGATIKRGKNDGKLSCSLKTEEEAEKCDIPFDGKSYRYNSSYLCAPFSSSLKDNTLTFSFKFGIS